MNGFQISKLFEVLHQMIKYMNTCIPPIISILIHCRFLYLFRMPYVHTLLLLTATITLFFSSILFQTRYQIVVHCIHFVMRISSV